MDRKRKSSGAACLFGAYRGIVIGVGAFIVTLLLLLNIYCTASIYPTGLEHVQFFKDAVLPQLAALLLCAAGAVVLRPYAAKLEKHWDDYPEHFSGAQRSLFFVLAGMCMVWVLSTQFTPSADSGVCAAGGLLLARHNPAYFEKGAYFSYHPHQMGLVLLEYFIGLVLGQGNSVAIQVLNALMIPAIYLMLSRIAKEMGLDRNTQLAVQLYGILFLPTTIYTGFVYGTTPGWFFAAAAILCELKYLKTGKLRSIFFAALLMLVSVMFRQNYLVFLIAMMLHLAACAFRDGRFVRVLGVLLLGLVFVLQSIIPGAAMKLLFGMEPETKGISYLSYPAMGMQESSNAPGWFNFYNIDSYINEADYDTDRQTELAAENIRESLKRFAADPVYAMDFYFRKEASMWCDPTFGALFYLPQGVTPQTDVPEWVDFFSDLEGGYKVMDYLNILQTLLWAGAAMWLVLQGTRDKEHPAGLLLLLTFIGVFLFQTLWEGKSQYVWPGYIMLLPLSLAGWQMMGEKTAGLFGAVRAKKLYHPSFRSALLVVLLPAVAAVGLLGAARITHVTDSLIVDTAELHATRQALQYAQSHALKAGDYVIRPLSDPELCLAYSEENGFELIKGSEAVTVFPYHGRYYIKAVSADALLLPSEAGLAEDSFLGVAEPEVWTIRDWGGDGLYISCEDDRFVTSTGGTLRLEKRLNDYIQPDVMWQFEAAPARGE